jgi:hypothetical protein
MEALEEDTVTNIILRHLSGSVEAMPSREKQVEGNQAQNGSMRVLEVCHFEHSKFKRCQRELVG